MNGALSSSSGAEHNVPSLSDWQTASRAAAAPMESNASSAMDVEWPTETRISVVLQFGAQRDMVHLERADDASTLEWIRARAKELIVQTTKGEQMDSAFDVLLFVHEPRSVAVLAPLLSGQQLENGSLVEVVVVERLMSSSSPASPHRLRIVNYKTPTFCDFCGQILIGIFKQGVQCELCNGNFHKKCSLMARNSCGAAATPSSSSSAGTVFSAAAAAAAAAAPTTPASSCSAQQEGTATAGMAVPHSFILFSYKTPTVCRVCDKMLFGLVKQGLRCRECKVNVHKKCLPHLPANCHIAEGSIVPLLERISVSSGSTASSCAQLVDVTATAQGGVDTEQVDTMIPLARLPGQAWQRNDSTAAKGQPLIEGWLIHFEGNEPDRRLRHYWVLADNKLSLYNEWHQGVNRARCYRQIALHEILAITPFEGTESPLDDRFPPHQFEIRTKDGKLYCVGERLDAWAKQSSSSSAASTSQRSNDQPPPSKQARPTAGIPPSAAQWLDALAKALQPPASRYDAPNAEPALEFTQVYQVLAEQTLGSGQFGTVYAGVHRESGREVAVKVIAKDRFSKKPTAAGIETLKTEVAILRDISHSGIVRLEAMFETADKIFVVMDKLNGDMLEMILSQVAGRLTERVTKFLLVQILKALQYLHNRGIAHCDLKPENVLLESLHSAYPQTKLCDFGYARVIGDAQFRKTIVGTPAYLPPEVLQKRGYNRSLDMWSVGVIIYVTLSGTFPFNDNEEIADQIQNAAFMFPSDPWKNISRTAVLLIQRLLRVNIDERLTCDECLANDWLQGPELYTDLRRLEARLQVARYLTDEGDDARYAEYLKSQGLVPA